MTSSDDSRDVMAIRLEHIAQTLRDDRVDCAAVIRGDKEAVEHARSVAKAGNETDNKDPNGMDDYYIREAKSCTRFVTQYGFVTDSLSEEEADFPVAYSIVAYTDTEMLVRLLRAIYRPQNYYCVHVDQDAPSSMHDAMSAVASCLPGVFLSPQRIHVEWARWSVLEADLICMQQLWNFPDWRYLINLTGQEFPLKTNAEIVRILKALNGANDVPGTTTYALNVRWGYRPFPNNLTPVKGPVHVTLNRHMVDFILHDRVSLELQEFYKQPTWGPDELFFAVFNNNPSLRIHGAYGGNLTAIEPPLDANQEYSFIDSRSITRYKQWMYDESGRCASNNVIRNICQLSTGDLPRMSSSKFLFANKFRLHQDRVAVSCLEEWLANHTRDYFTGKLEMLDVTQYKEMDIVKNMVVDDPHRYDKDRDKRRHPPSR